MVKTSNKIKDRIKDVNDRHKDWIITNFDTRQNILYDSTNDKAYIIHFSVAILKDGKKISYAKKFAKATDDILNKIKTNNVVENTT